MLLVRAACCAYWCLLSLLLLHPDPLSLIGMERLPGGTGGHGTHFVFFVGLVFFTLASRLPVRRGLLAAILIGYALATEALQAFVPTRVVDPIDVAENVTGLIAGALIWWIVSRKTRVPTHGDKRARDCPNHNSDGEENQATGRPEVRHD